MPVLDETPHPGVGVEVDDEVEVLVHPQATLHEQGHVKDGDTARWCLAAQRRHSGADCRCRDPLEAVECLTVREHDGGQLSPIEPAVDADHAVAEAIPDHLQCPRARLDDLARDCVGVDDMRAEGAEAGRDTRLSRPDAPGDTDAQHSGHGRHGLSRRAGRGSRRARRDPSGWA